MNNLALLDTLPSHLSKWGTGVLPASDRTSSVRHGDGLSVLDLGNCSLPFEAIQATFLSQKWSHLRSLTLHSNPLVLTHPDFATLLQESSTLPNLQIIDSKRIVQRKRQGEIQESKIERRRREKKEKKRMTGANAKETSGAMRVWGGAKDERDTIASTRGEATSKIVDPIGEAPNDSAKAGKRKRLSKPTTESAQSDERPRVLDKDTEAIPKARKRVKRNKESLADQSEQPAQPTTATIPSHSIHIPEPPKTSKRREAPSTDNGGKGVQQDRSDPKAPDGTKGKARKGPGGKVETVAQSAGGVDLKNVFAKPSIDLGGW